MSPRVHVVAVVRDRRAHAQGRLPAPLRLAAGHPRTTSTPISTSSTGTARPSQVHDLQHADRQPDERERRSRRSSSRTRGRPERLTLSPGLRFDYFNSSIPEQTCRPAASCRRAHFDAIPNIPNWKNVSPRFGASYDLSGHGRTAIKGNLGSYVQSQGTGLRRDLQPDGLLDRRPHVDRPEPRRHRAGERARDRRATGTFGVRRNQNPAPTSSGRTSGCTTSALQHELRTRPRRVGQLQPAELLQDHSGRRTSRRRCPRTRSTSVPNPQIPGQTLPIYNLDARGARPRQSARRQLAQQPRVLQGRRRVGQHAVPAGRRSTAARRPAGRSRSPATWRIPTTCGSAIRRRTTCRS